MNRRENPEYLIGFCDYDNNLKNYYNGLKYLVEVTENDKGMLFFENIDQTKQIEAPKESDKIKKLVKKYR